MAKDEFRTRQDPSATVIADAVTAQQISPRWVDYFQVVGSMPIDDQGRAALFALSRELPTEEAAVAALTQLFQTYPTARVQRGGTCFDNEASAKEFSDFISSDTPPFAKGKILCSWHHSSAKADWEAREREQWRQGVKSLGFIRYRGGHIISHWAPKAADGDEWDAGEDDAFALLALLQRFPGRGGALVANILDENTERKNPPGRRYSARRFVAFASILGKALASASPHLHIEPWRHEVLELRQKYLVGLKDCEAIMAKQRSERARHAALCRHRKAKAA